VYILGKGQQNAIQMMTATHVKVKNITMRVEGVDINFIWTIFSPLWIHLITSTQELSTVVELSNRTIKKAGGLWQ
jgi:hypothetical protein